MARSIMRTHALWTTNGAILVALHSSLLLSAFGVSADADAGLTGSQPETGSSDDDLWTRLTTEEWQPGRVGDFNTSNPMKDLECEGPQASIKSDSSLDWAQVKEQLHEYVAQVLPVTPMQNPWLLNVAMRIQRDEPDTCVLGITATSAFLLPVTMPKFRNMARMLSSDQDLFVLNVTFYDTLRSGFPVFGILDSLATPEYRAWFRSEESLLYFPFRAATPACETPAARALLAEIARGRTEWVQTPLLPGLSFLTEAGGTKGGCPLAAAASLLVYALARAEEAEISRWSTRESVLRDIIELVSRAEELIRDHIAEEDIKTGELVASPWNLWWLLHRLQLVLPRFFQSEVLE